MEFECKKCGQCCGGKFVIHVFEEDVSRWKSESRSDIIESVVDGLIEGTGNGPCPWLINNLCSIHSTKPLWCRPFPPSKLKAKIHNCPGYN